MSWGVISEMGHVAIQTRRLEDSVFDATQILGLRQTERQGSHVYLAAADVHHEIIYIESEHDAIDHIGLVARDQAALQEVRRRVDQAGCQVSSFIESVFIGFRGVRE